MRASFIHGGSCYIRLEDFIGASPQTFQAFKEWLIEQVEDRERIPGARYDLATVEDALSVPRPSIDGFVQDLASWSAFHAGVRRKSEKLPEIASTVIRRSMPTDVFNWNDDGKVEANFRITKGGRDIAKFSTTIDENGEPETTFIMR